MINKKTVSIVSIEAFLVMFLTCRFCTFSYLEGIIDTVYIMLSRVCAVLIFAGYFMRGRKGSKVFLYVSIFYIIMGISTLIFSPENIRRVVMQAYPNIAFIAYVDIRSERYYDKIIKGFNFFLVINCVLCALLSLMDVQIASNRYLLGDENKLVFPYMISVAVLARTVNMKWRYLGVYILLLSMSILHVFSAGNTLGWICFLTVGFLLGTKQINLRGKFLLGMYFVLFFLIVVLRIQNMFEWLIVNILNKNLTLTNRTVIWDNVLEQISDHFWLGYGVQETGNIIYTYIYRIGRPIIDRYYSAHNQILQTLWETGFLSMIPIVLLLYCGFISCDKFKDCKLSFMLKSLLLGMLIAMISEAPSWTAVFVLITIIYYSLRLNNANGEMKDDS